MNERLKNIFIVFLLIIIIILSWLLITLDYGRYCKPLIKEKKASLEFTIPTNFNTINSKSLLLEHKLLRDELWRATQEKGETGYKAEKLFGLLKSYFFKQEEFVVPALDILPDLLKPDFAKVKKNKISFKNTSKTEIQSLLKQQQAIVILLYSMMISADKENKPVYVSYAKKLIRNLQTDEKEIFPAVILIRNQVNRFPNF